MSRDEVDGIVHHLSMPLQPSSNDPVVQARRDRAEALQREMAEGRKFLAAQKSNSMPPLSLDDEQVKRAAVLNDRQRMKEILGCPEAKLAPDVATGLAFDTNVPTAQAIDILKTAVAPLTRHQAGPAGALPSMSQDEIDAGWRAAAEAGGLPLKPKTEAPAPARRQKDATTQSDIDRDWADAAASAGIPRK